MSNSKIYAFQSWGSLQLSSLYEGQRAVDFIASHYESGTFATLHEGGEEVKVEYEELKSQIEADRYAEMWG